MQDKEPNGWQRLLQRVPATRPGAWFFRLMLHHIDRPLFQLTNGKVTLPGLFIGLPMIMLTTRGAKTGQPRTVPLAGIHDGDAVILIASYYGSSGHPAWYRNLLANPEAIVSANGRTGAYIAHQAAGDEREKYWKRATAIYIGYAAYQRWAAPREIPVMVLTPKS